MGGAADLPQRGSSPLKRPAADLDADVPSSQRDDVDMIEMPSTGQAENAEEHRQLPSPVETQEVDVRFSEAVPEDGAPLVRSASTEIPPIDEQITTITTICQAEEQRQLVEGQKAYVVSRSWLNKVISHGSESRKNSKTEVVSELGPVDNSDITKGVIRGLDGEDFVQLKDGYNLEQFILFPDDAWNLVMEWYGLMPGTFPIIRYAHNTNYEPTGMPNVQFEFHPLVFKLHRLYSDNGVIIVDQKTKVTNPAAPRLVFSRSSKYIDFLKAIKKEAGVKRETYIRLWRVPRLQPAAESTVAINTTTPPASRPSSPAQDELIGPVQQAPQDAWTQLLLDVPSFTALRREIEREVVDYPDHSVNPKYNGSMTMHVASFGNDDTLVIDERVNTTDFISNHVSKGAKSGNKTLAPSTSQTNSGRNSPAPGPMTRGRAKKAGKPQGAVGLSNLGNTCYMNSALQCVRSVEELTKYFLTGAAEQELDRDNPLGYHGEVAMSYGQLLSEIYRDNAPNSVAPRYFKTTIGRFAPSFSGYGQQDSQEFLGFLLDGLQEDLSRVKKKPYIEKPDSTDEMVNDPQAIREMAAKVWDITKKRDDSVIADLFTGMYKSTLVCPVCSKVSITFDPFNNLTLQLPIETSWAHKIQYFPLNDKPIQMSIDIDKNASVAAIKAFVSKRFNVPVERLFIIEEFKHKFYKHLKDFKVASEDIGANDNVWVYELEAQPTNWPCLKKDKQPKKNSYSSTLESDADDVPEWSDRMADRMLVPVFHRQPSAERRYGRKQWHVEPMPHFIILTPEEAKSEDMIKRKILEKVATFTTWHDFDDEFDTNISATDDADIVITTGSDADSSGGSKVVARSVDGEDELVDVAMNDAPPKSASPFKSRRPRFINPKAQVPPGMQNMFDIGFFSDSKSMVQTGWQTVTEDKVYPSITTRIPQSRSSNDEDADIDGEADTFSRRSSFNGRAQSDSSGDSGFANGVSTTTRMVEESSDEDEALPPPIARALPVRPAGPKSGVKVGHNKRRHPIKTYSKKNQRADRKAERKAERKARNYSVTDSEASDSDEGPLVRLGEGLVVDWESSAWETLFTSDNADDPMRGKATFKNVEFMDDPELVAKRTARAQRKKNGITLDDCLDEFGKEEILSEMDTWYCPRCKEHRRASKKFELWKTPDILVMHLKRFSSSGMRRDKLDVMVDFPIEGLDLSSRVIETEDGKTEIYDLFAVDDHWGGLGGGHYTAFAKNFLDGEWWEYNDSSAIKLSNLSRIVSASAYLLFYRRRSSVPLGGPRFQQIFQDFGNSADPSEDEASESGEDQGLVGNSSLRGSSSALTGVGVARHQQNRGGPTSAGSTAVNPSSLEQLPKYEAEDPDDSAPPSLLGATVNQNTYKIHDSIEDEGIGMMESEHDGLLPRPSWGFGNIMNDFNSNPRGDNMISGTGSDAGSDIVEHNSSATSGSIRGRIDDFENTVAEDDGVEFVDQSPVPDLDEMGQAAAIGLQEDVLNEWRRSSNSRQTFPRQFEVTADDDRFEVEEPAVEIHVGNSDDLKID